MQVIIKWLLTHVFCQRRIVIASEKSIKTIIITPIHQIIMLNIAIFMIILISYLVLSSGKLYGKIDKKTRKIEQMTQDADITKKELQEMITQMDTINEYYSKMKNRKIANNKPVKNGEDNENDNEGTIDEVDNKYGINNVDTIDPVENHDLGEKAELAYMTNQLTQKMSYWYELASQRIINLLDIFKSLGVVNCESGIWNSVKSKFLHSMHNLSFNNTEREAWKELKYILCSKNIIQKLERHTSFSKNNIPENINLIKNLVKLEDLAFSVPLGNPMPQYKRLGSKFGERIDPVYHKRAFHFGYDIIGQYGANIISTGHGRVVRVARSGSYGNVIYVDHSNGIVTRYAHLSQINVRLGQKVVAGSVIGREGTSGKSTGAHLHYEIRINNVAINPIKFIQGER